MSTAAVRMRRSRPGLGDDSDFGGSSFWLPGGGAGDVLSETDPGLVTVSQLQQQNQQGNFNNIETPFPYFGPVSGQYADPYGSLYHPETATGGAGSARPVRPIVAGSPAAAAASSPAGALSGVTSLLGAPIYSGAPITWGWALLGALAVWLLLRRS